MRTRLIAAGVLGLVVLLLLWNILFFSPAGKDVDKANTRRDTAEQQHSQLEAEKQRLEKSQQQAPAVRAQLARLQAAIPTTPDLEGFLRAAFDVKTKSGVDWVSIAPNLPAPGVGPSEIKMQIVVRGGFFQVLDYLNRFEDPNTMRRLVVVDGINISTSAGTTGSTGSSGSTTTTTGGSSASGAPDLSVTLDARMFTQAAATTGGTPTTPTTTRVTTPTSAAGGNQ